MAALFAALTVPAVVAGPLAAPASWQTNQSDLAPVRALPTVRWTRTLVAPTGLPLTTDGTRIFAAGVHALYAYGLDGALRWKLDGDLGAAPLPSPAGLWVPGTDTLRLVDPATGVVQASGPPGPAADVAPVVAPDLRWVDFSGALHSWAGWAASVGGRAAGPPAADGPRTWVLTTAGDLVLTEDGAVVRSVALGAPGRGGPVLDPSGVYAAIGAVPPLPGGVVALDRDGSERWRWSGTLEPGGGLALGAHLYVPDRGGHLVALDRATGRVVWDVEAFGPFVTRPIVAGSFVYAANGDGNLYAIDAADGGVAWTLPLGAPPSADPVLAPGLLVVPLADGRVAAFGVAP